MKTMREMFAQQYPDGWHYGQIHPVDMIAKSLVLLGQLCWCAQNRRLMTYSELGRNIDLPDEYRAGSTLASISGNLAGAIGDYCASANLPPLNALLVRQGSFVPGDGIAPYLKAHGIDNFEELSDNERRKILDGSVYPHVFSAAVWDEVLKTNGFIPRESHSYSAIRNEE